MKMKLAKVGVIAVKDSHGRHHSPGCSAPVASYDEADAFLKKHFPAGTESRAWGGLTLDSVVFDKNTGKFCEKMPDAAVKQRKKVRAFVSKSTARVAVMECGSNAIFALMTDDGNNVLPAGESFWNDWNALPESWRISPHFNKKMFISKAASMHIKERVRSYVRNVIEIYENSDVEFVFHVSILERLYKSNHVLEKCNLYYAYANFYLKKELQKLNGLDPGNRVINRSGKVIGWHFVNVASQFYKAKQPKNLFLKKERNSGRMVHRNKEAMEELVEMYMAEVYTTLAGIGAFGDVVV